MFVLKRGSFGGGSGGLGRGGGFASLANGLCWMFGACCGVNDFFVA